MRLVAAPPQELTAAATTALRLAGGAGCTLYLADYRLDDLRPVGGGPALPIDGSGHGRCYAAQRLVRLEDGVLLAPVTVRGDRLGVLELRTAPDGGDSGDGDGDGLAADGARRLGDLLGQALLATDRITDVYRTVRRGRSMTLSAEIQWELLPGRALDAGFAVVAGQLEPAYSVVGDVYDWALDAAGLTAALVDGSGAGARAATTTALAVAALRNARREGADLVGMARMADQALHARFAGAAFTSTVLLGLDAAAGAVRILAAGSGTVVHVGRRTVRVLDLERDPPLGAEEDFPYRITRTLPVAPGDRVVVLSDGITDAQVRDGVFGAGLTGLVNGLRLLDAAGVVRALIRELRAFHAGDPLRDDAVVLCLDVTGRAD